MAKQSDPRSAFAQHYAGCERALYRYIRPMVPRHEDALDVLQETATDLWQKYGQYDPAQPFGVWARSFAYRRVLKYYRRAGTGDRRLLSFREEVVALLSDESAQHAGVLELRRQALQQCLQKVTTDDMQLLEQRYWRESSVRQLSQEKGVEEGNLYARLRTIRNQLQKCIEKTIPELQD